MDINVDFEHKFTFSVTGLALDEEYKKWFKTKQFIPPFVSVTGHASVPNASLPNFLCSDVARAVYSNAQSSFESHHHTLPTFSDSNLALYNIMAHERGTKQK